MFDQLATWVATPVWISHVVSIAFFIFHGHDESNRRLTNSSIHDALVELSELNGAFVVQGDGFITARN
jgi:hypothetical protein